MATIQFKRRTTAGTGPFTGTSGVIKAGEPQVDFNGGNLYISKADKTASSGTPISQSDYMEIPSTSVVDNRIDNKISALGLGTASTKNTGTGSGQIPVLDSSGKLPSSVVPNAVSSVNGKTGAVTISLTDLSGVSTSTFNSHTASSSHLTTEQITKLSNVQNTSISNNNGSYYEANLTTFNSKTITNGLVLYSVLDTKYSPNAKIYSLGIDSSKVLTPSSIIDGGTF